MSKKTWPRPYHRRSGRRPKRYSDLFTSRRTIWVEYALDLFFYFSPDGRYSGHQRQNWPSQRARDRYQYPPSLLLVLLPTQNCPMAVARRFLTLPPDPISACPSVDNFVR